MELEEFLKECKNRVKNNNLDFIPRRENNKSRRKYGLSIMDVEDAILNLTLSDYKQGPEEDYSYPNEYVWVFLKEINSVSFYIKLKLRENGEVVCISFHD